MRDAGAEDGDGDGTLREAFEINNIMTLGCCGLKPAAAQCSRVPRISRLSCLPAVKRRGFAYEDASPLRGEDELAVPRFSPIRKLSAALKKHSARAEKEGASADRTVTCLMDFFRKQDEISGDISVKTEGINKGHAR